jgi:hypothetical protein
MSSRCVSVTLGQLQREKHEEMTDREGRDVQGEMDSNRMQVSTENCQSDKKKACPANTWKRKPPAGLPCL